MAVVRLESIATRRDHLLCIFSSISIALSAGIDLCIEVETREERPGSSLVCTTIASLLRSKEVSVDSLQLRLDVLEEVSSADLLRVDLTSRRCFGDEGWVTIEVDHYPVLVGT